MNNMSTADDAGDIDARMHEDKFVATYRQMACELNSMINGHVDINKKAIEVVNTMSAINNGVKKIEDIISVIE